MKQLKKELLKEISNFLVEYGFEKKIFKQSFWKYTVNGRAMIHLSFIDHAADFDVVVSVSVRLDELENMVNKANPLLKESEGQLSSTIGVELGNYKEGKQKRWTIKDENDLLLTVGGVCQDIKTIAIPFIEKFTDINTIFEIMLRDDKEAWQLTSLHHRRAMNAVGLAILLKKEEMLKIIVETKTKFLTERNDFGLKIFLKFVETIA
jgi:hypothetical protein